jgi:hypothetical protein
MAAPKIKKKKTSAKAPIMPRQGAIPCLVLVVITLIIVGALIFAAIRTVG